MKPSVSRSVDPDGGAVESDETYIGAASIEHAPQYASSSCNRFADSRRRGDVYLGKTAVAGMLDRETRKVRTKVIPNVRRETLQDAILANIAPGSKLYTDAAVYLRSGSENPNSFTKLSIMLASTCADRFIRTESKTSGSLLSGPCVEPTLLLSHSILTATLTSRYSVSRIALRKTTR